MSKQIIRDEPIVDSEGRKIRGIYQIMNRSSVIEFRCSPSVRFEDLEFRRLISGRKSLPLTWEQLFLV
jgi:hypothetical protein